MKARITAILVAVFTVFFATVTASACECTERPTVAEAYEGSLNVAVLVVKSVGDKQAVLIVGVALKGFLREDEELIFQQSAGKDCKWYFGPKDIDKAFLFFLDKTPADGVWQASTCSPSKFINKAGKDMQELRIQIRQPGPQPNLPLTDEPKPAAKPRDGE